MIDIAILEKLDACEKAQRLENLQEVLKTTQFPPMVPQYINNHIHTTYSFSPYSPTAAVYAARMEGLCTAGIIDHDSISGAREFLEAAKLVDIPVTIGMECRATMDGTRLQGRRTNNPDQVGVSYMTIQSVPHDQIDRLNAFFAPYRTARDVRNRQMIEKINALLGEDLDYDRDVLPLSQAADGGGVTERHLMYALARKMVARIKNPMLQSSFDFVLNQIIYTGAFYLVYIVLYWCFFDSALVFILLMATWILSRMFWIDYFHYAAHVARRCRALFHFRAVSRLRPAYEYLAAWATR